MENKQAPGRTVVGDGTQEAQWQAWPRLSRFPPVSVDKLIPDGGRAIIVAPHPDDEILATGGLLALLWERRARKRLSESGAVASGTPAAPPQTELAADHESAAAILIAVTDGAASHPGSSQWSAERLAQTRPLETAAALDRLGIAGLQLIRLGLPDGDVKSFEDTLAARIAQVTRSTDVVISTWRNDGHPDHEACGRAALRACAETGARLIETPVWTWHWASPDDARVPWHRAVSLRLSPAAAEAKRAAVTAFVSQLEPDATTGSAAILPPFVLQRLLRDFEVFLV
ncbi:MAG: PIG-L deacetylase family protein [Janthinobacterium lividum]